MKKIKTILPFVLLILLLTGCDAGKEDVVEDVAYELSVEYNVPITDIEIEVIEYGTSVFSTNQLKVTIKSKDVEFYFIQKDDPRSNFKRVPIKTE